MIALRAWFRRKRNWCPQSRWLAWVTDPPIANRLAFAAVVSLICLLQLQPWTVVGLLLVGWLVKTGCLSAWYGRVKGWQVCDAGLRELRWGQPSRLHYWASMQRLVEEVRMVALVVDDDMLWLPADVRGAGGLLRRLRAGKAGRGPTAPAPVDPQQIADWLDDGRGTPLDCRVWRPREAGFYIVGLPASCVLFLLLHGIASPYPGPALVLGLLLLISFARLVGRPVEVSASGFRRGRTWLFSWDELRHIERSQDGWIFHTDSGTFQITGHKRLAETAEKVLAAKRAGAVLPRMTDIPDHALSRAESAEASAERGLSRTAGDGP